MDLQDQLKNLFPDHVPEENEAPKAESSKYWLQDTPILCKYEKRKGKPVTLLEGYTGAEADFKKLTRDLKSYLSVGGSYKNDIILIQGDYRDKIMGFLKDNGFSVKRVGG
ncbi:translation initiation factor [Flagellimonas sp. 389]|uniref:translation initiation factor n=1 Tax=Flagellimonas sp. 389 TaxID=2835862 RepID=UPI001BD682B9|nr:translation initiation factor [uncultured Allomuricauda sp.]MBS9463444.1 translation initiation factor [Flagellimonas sp. 389]